MKAQIDENLPPALARALNALVEIDGHEVVHVTDYAKGAPDLELFRRAIEDGVQVHITRITITAGPQSARRSVGWA